jgi:hypothetical protein
MRKHRMNLAMWLTLIACAPITACSGGGGGSAPVTSTPVVTQSAPTPATPTFCSGCVGPTSNGYNYDTGIASGPIAAPVPASFGTAPTQMALAGGPSFDGKSGSYPANVTFPLISTSLKQASPGISAVASPDATLTVISSSANSQNLQLTIPSLNLNVNVNFGEGIVTNIDGFTGGNSYVVWGGWDLRPNSNGPIQSNSEFVFGYETPASAMPATGTASYSGLATGSVFKQGNGTIIETQVTGTGNLSANFSSGQVTGALVSMQQNDGFGFSPSHNLQWNDVALNANIAPGSNRFSGTTAATSAPGTGFSLAGSATGHIDGAFYGPAAQNVGAVWSLSDGAISAIGTLVGK